MSGLQMWSLSYTPILLPVPPVILDVVSSDQVNAVEVGRGEGGEGGNRVGVGEEDEGKRGVEDAISMNVSNAMDVVEVNMTDAGT